MAVRKRSALRVEAARLCKLPEMQDVPTRTIAQRLSKEFKVTLENARATVRLCRGAKGKKYRNQRDVERQHGKAGHVPQMPPSKAEKWEPFDLPGSKVAILSDLHVPYHDEQAVLSAVEYCKKRQPDTLFLNGDAMDFYSISRWLKDPRKRNFKAELDACQELLKWLRHEFPKCEIIWKAGNHEERWDHYLWNNAIEICDHPRMQIESILEFEDLGITAVKNQRPVLAGKLPIFHGHELGRSIFSPVNPARGAFLRTHHTVMVGHSHQTSGHADTNLWHEETFVWSTGCLCDLTPEYARLNRWNHGFAWCEIGSGGTFDVDNLRISQDGEVRGS